jgi:hypothetical protein
MACILCLQIELLKHQNVLFLLMPHRVLVDVLVFADFTHHVIQGFYLNQYSHLKANQMKSYLTRFLEYVMRPE